jgi:cobalt/nickel transport system permease protein
MRPIGYAAVGPKDVMHIPDGYLSPGTCAALGAAMLPAWAVSAWRLRSRLGTREVPMLALGSAFSFVVMMFNVPAPGGTTGHAVGAGLVAVLLGPAAALVTTTVALAIQALLFGDGGLLTFGANCLNMALIMPVVTYSIYRLLTSGTPTPARRALAAGVGAYFGINVAAFAAALELGIQPLIAHAVDGTPLYCPYGLGASIPGMMIPHLVIFGLIEAVATAGVVRWADRAGFAAETRSATPRFALGWAWLGALCLLSPLGVLAAGEAWGEWGLETVKKDKGYAPAGLERLTDLWKGLLPDYNLRGGADGGLARALAYVLSALVGVALVGGVVWVAGRLVTRSSGADKSGPTA